MSEVEPEIKKPKKRSKSLKASKPLSFLEKYAQARKDDKSWKRLGASYVWLSDPKEGFIVGEVVERFGEEFVVTTADGQVD
jgi:hypothetical protein